MRAGTSSTVQSEAFMSSLGAAEGNEGSERHYRGITGERRLRVRDLTEDR